jgi:hypothetical protein
MIPAVAASETMLSSAKKRSAGDAEKTGVTNTIAVSSGITEKTT